MRASASALRLLEPEGSVGQLGCCIVDRLALSFSGTGGARAVVAAKQPSAGLGCHSDGRREASYTVRASVSQHFSGSATVARAAGGAVSVRAGRRVRMLRTRVCHSAHHLSVRAVCFVAGHGTPDPHPHPHPRFAGDGGSAPIPIPDLPGIGDHPHPRFPSGVPCPASWGPNQRTEVPSTQMPRRGRPPSHGQWR